MKNVKHLTPCAHVAEIKTPAPVTPDGCEECLKMGADWVHLRICRTCGHVGCCDDSQHKHATAHFHLTNHPIMQSFEPGETWGYCYVDRIPLDPDVFTCEAIWERRNGPVTVV